MIFLFFESAFGICLGCMVYPMIYKTPLLPVSIMLSVLMLFLIPVGVGIPAGVLLARTKCGSGSDLRIIIYLPHYKNVNSEV